MKKGFPCGSAGKESGCNAGDLGSIPGLGRSPGKGKGYPLQYSGLENSMDFIKKLKVIHIYCGTFGKYRKLEKSAHCLNVNIIFINILVPFLLVTPHFLDDKKSGEAVLLAQPCHKVSVLRART